jgi:starch synthase (maltosyl-transferring)
MPRESQPPSTELPRVVIEGVSPAIEGGRYPIKRTVGSDVEVAANIFKDGHDLIAARVVVLPPNDVTWQTFPLVHHYDEDRWYGAFPTERLGRYRWAVEAWPDHWGTFRTELQKRLAAGQDVRSELLVGAALLDQYAASRPADVAVRLRTAAAKIGDVKAKLDERVKIAQSDELATTTYGALTPVETTRSPVYRVLVDRSEASFAAWYELFPRSQGAVRGVHGTFDDTARRLRRDLPPAHSSHRRKAP